MIYERMLLVFIRNSYLSAGNVSGFYHQRLTLKCQNKEIRFEVLTAVVMNVEIFWDTAPCSPYVNRRSSETLVHIRDTRRCIPEVTTVKESKTLGTKCIK
jgi:hypothetical protein